ncbi:hypothetical protein O6H91_03G031400 [Diphasiastrum complanatum]|uniref:Uncharacterized protein n=1 Tax=Diphasiastrum complanatum TaxID=34168 RepID=A0ACC2E516_DIPCM|nr:hypothetical protein O6H91_03G031400 [Diphasiastrum complanatum]
MQSNGVPPAGSSSSSSCVPSGRSELIILGSGSSTGVPSPMCLLQPSDPPCKVCHSAMAAPPEHNKNYRCNPSLLINYMREDGHRRFIQIDAGKSFKEQVLRWFPRYNIPRLDALILTHEHADAILGLDDIRGVQPYNPFNMIEPMPVFLSRHTMDSVEMKFPYLVQKSLKEGQEIRRVAQLQWHVIKSSSMASFEAAGLQFISLPVMHGEDYVSLGFLFGKKSKIAYISDVSRIPLEIENVISKQGAGPVDVLILDTLYKEGTHNTHFCLPQSLEAVKRLCPKKAFFVGMTHEFDHELVNEELGRWSEREGIEVQLAYDGLRILVDL